MSLLNIDAGDWVKAKHFFSTNPNAIKLSKNASGCAHSFIKINNRIVAVGYKLGAGTFGVVKVAEDETGANFAIKVEGGKISTDDLAEEQILALMHYSFGMVDRQLNAVKTFIPDIKHMTFQSDHKKYKLLELLEGTDLIFELYDKDAYEKLDSYIAINKLNQEQKLIIAIKFCQILKLLQDLRIIHADIKPENIKVKIEKGIITVKIMDFGFSMLLPLGTNATIDTCKGTGPYMAPEIFDGSSPKNSKLSYSFASDIYATGIMFKWNFGLSDNICTGMIKRNPLDRDSVDTIINHLLEELESLSVLSTEARNFIETLKNPSKGLPIINAVGGATSAEPVVPVLPVSASPQASPIEPTPQPKLLGLPKVMLGDAATVQLKRVVPKPKDEPTTPVEPRHMIKLKPVQRPNVPTPQITMIEKRPLPQTPKIVLDQTLQPPQQPRPHLDQTQELPQPTQRHEAKLNMAIAANKRALTSPLSPKKEVEVAPTQIDFAKIKPSEAKLNRIAMLKQRLAQATPLEKLTTAPLLQPTPVIVVAYETDKAVMTLKEKLAKKGVATPLVAGLSVSTV